MGFHCFQGDPAIMCQYYLYFFIFCFVIYGSYGVADFIIVAIFPEFVCECVSTYIVLILEGQFFSQNILRRQKLTSNFLFIIPKQSQNQLLFLIFQIINVTSLGGLIIRGGQVVIYY
eukprot:TRINITY_DN2326_c0_g1_i4.p7 TRINITY_DN2326_c0_g1~~TRINITY_DN2326_c0_g1_i4.p7  ORF type:complete len:117 (-),score=2.52 TRINITY_DN2326_c0_g1_i4:280-630(-)